MVGYDGVWWIALIYLSVSIRNLVVVLPLGLEGS